MRKLVIIPTYNEKENISAMIDKVFSLPEPFELLVIDDGSPDGTAEIVRQRRKEFPETLHLLDRSGRYIPAVVSGTYSLIDKLITSVAAVIATGAVALLGYTTTMPQPTDPYTSGIFWMTLAIKYGLPMLGWVITLIAMPGCPLTKEEMVNVQKRIADKKDALRHEVIAENMQ